MHSYFCFRPDQASLADEDEYESPYVPPRYLPHTTKLRRTDDTASCIRLPAVDHRRHTLGRPYTPPQFLPRTSTKLRDSVCVTDDLLRLKPLRRQPIDKDLPGPLKQSGASSTTFDFLNSLTVVRTHSTRPHPFRRSFAKISMEIVCIFRRYSKWHFEHTVNLCACYLRLPSPVFARIIVFTHSIH